MILTYNGMAVKLGSDLINLPAVKVGEEMYDVVRIGDYEWITTNLKNTIGDSITHDGSTFYKRAQVNAIEEILPAGWHLPDKAAFDNLFENRSDFNFILGGYINASDNFRYGNERCYMMGNDEEFPYLMYWYKITGGTPDFDNPSIADAYSGETEYRFTVRICRKYK